MKDAEPDYRYTQEDLLYMMGRLRDPRSGCPWDLEQTPASIIRYSIEEVYELADVIERDQLDYANYRDELGDVLLQVVFLTQFATEDGAFEFADVTDNLCRKMIRRHPHVFPSGKLYAQTGEKSLLDSASEVSDSWEAIKAAERGDRPLSLFDNIPVGLPALSRALKFQKRAAKIGLDWSDVQGALNKVDEESAELRLALDRIEHSAAPDVEPAPDNIAEIDAELGDLLFSVVNVARKLKRDPEQLLRGAVTKFAGRAEFVSEHLQKDTTGAVASAQEIDRLWQKSKTS